MSHFRSMTVAHAMCFNYHNYARGFKKIDEDCATQVDRPNGAA
jgi:hypothetical protein